MHAAAVAAAAGRPPSQALFLIGLSTGARTDTELALSTSPCAYHLPLTLPNPPTRSCRRGKFRSKPWQAVLDEARHLVDSGVVELNLIAEDTNQ